MYLLNTILFFFLFFYNYNAFGQSISNDFFPDTFADPIEIPATFQGHDLSYFMNTFVIPNLQYPDSAKNNCIQGRVIIKFIVDTLGQIENIDLIRSLDKNCDKEGIRVIKLSSGMWSPSILTGKKIKQSICMTIKFNLPDSICKTK